MRVRGRAGQPYDDLVVAGLHALAPHLDGEPDPAWQTTTRARLVAMAAVRRPEPVPASPLRRVLTDGVPAPARWRTGLTACLAGAALGVTGLATLVAVATDARPGDVLYGLKRGTEQTQLALAGDARGEVLLALAGTRLEEVRALVDNGTTALPDAASSGSGGIVLAASGATLVVETLETMDAQTAEGAAWLTGSAVDAADPGPLVLLAEWAATQSGGLAEVRDDVPAAAEDDVAGSLDLLSDIATRVSGLQSALGCADGPAVVGADELGPVPALCPADRTTAAAPDSAGGDGSVAGPGVPDPGSTPGPAPLPAPSPGGLLVPRTPDAAEGGALTPRVPSLPTGDVPPPPSVPLPLPTPLPTLPGSLPAPPQVPSTQGDQPTPGEEPALPGTPDPGLVPGATTPPTVEVCLPPLVVGSC